MIFTAYATQMKSALLKITMNVLLSEVLLHHVKVLSGSPFLISSIISMCVGLDYHHV
jgi:hypothetical protein